MKSRNQEIKNESRNFFELHILHFSFLFTLFTFFDFETFVEQLNLNMVTEPTNLILLYEQFLHFLGW